jgi:hypothetical protein
MDFLSILFSYQLILLSIAIYGVIFIIRSILESKWSLVGKKYYNLSLALAPIILGAASGLLPGLPYPDSLSQKASRIAFGIVAGLFSSTIFKTVKGLLEKASGENQSPPPTS